MSPHLVERIPHGTLINPYTSASRCSLLEGFGVDCRSLSGLTAVIPGFLRPDKGLDTALEAYRMLGEGYKLIVAGEFRDEKLREGLATAENVLLIEKYLSSSEILRLIAASDAVLLPYRDRPGTLSVSGILHLSMGSLKPIIGTRVPRLVELYVRAPRMTVKPGDPQVLAERIAWVRRNYEHAVAYMAEVYSYAVRTEWSRMARRHYRLYKHLLQGKRQKECK